MPNELDRTPPMCKGAVVGSLVAAVACVLASDALASRAPAEPCVREQELSARVAAIVDRVRLVDPTLLRDLPADKKIVQFRN
jgi:hypothetical protein